MTDITELKKMIHDSKNVCVFTGAGISCPSGIPDFRSANGLYNRIGTGNYRPEEIISHSFFTANTDQFYDFYKNNMVYPEARPNAAHKYFSDLEKTGKTVTVITQNIDGLHSAAGSSRVYELHGCVKRNYCTKCGAYYDENFIMNCDGVPKCPKDGKVIKPDVVLYDEPLDDAVVSKAIAAIKAADLMLVIGTSLVVYPAASYIRYFHGDHLVLINKSETKLDGMADIVINDNIINVVGKF